MADDAWRGPWAGGADFAEKIDFRGRIFGQNQPSEFGMGDGGHETAADDGDFLAVQCVEPWCLRDFLDCARPDGRKDGVSAVLTVFDDARQCAGSIDAFRIRGGESSAEYRCK